MARKSLPQMLDEVAGKISLLEGERNEAFARMKALELEVGKLSSLISLAESKVDEILKVGANDEISQRQTESEGRSPRV